MSQIEQKFNLEIQKGIMLPTIAMSRILNGKVMIEEIEKSDLKSRVYSFMDNRDKTTVKDIVDEFHLEPEEVIQLLDEMEKEGKIRQL